MKYALYLEEKIVMMMFFGTGVSCTFDLAAGRTAVVVTLLQYSRYGRKEGGRKEEGIVPHSTVQYHYRASFSATAQLQLCECLNLALRPLDCMCKGLNEA